MTEYYTHSKLLESISFSTKSYRAYPKFNLFLFIFMAVNPFFISTNLNAADIYQWEDKNGVVHFSDESGRIPNEYRDKAKVKEIDPSANILPYRQNDQKSKPKNEYRVDNAGSENDSLREKIMQKIADLDDEKKAAEEQLNLAHRKYVISLGSKGEKSSSSLNSVSYRRKEYNEAKARLDIVLKKIEDTQKSLESLR